MLRLSYAGTPDTVESPSAPARSDAARGMHREIERAPDRTAPAERAQADRATDRAERRFRRAVVGTLLVLVIAFAAILAHVARNVSAFL